MTAQDLWFSPALGARILRGLLTPLSLLYSAGWETYLWLYRIGIKKAKQPHRPVICVGNLTVGGSGKTPVSLYLYDLLSEMGREVVVSCSGYGSSGQRSADLAPEGELVTSLWGDEAAMLRWLRPEMKLVVGRDRVRAAEIVQSRYPEAVLLLDDGFQHLPLRKCFSVILDEPSPPNSKTLPAGPYREPRSNRKRADVIIPGKFAARAEHVKLASTASSRDPVPLPPAPIQVLCAIARPDRFLDSLTSRGFELRFERTLGDHDPLEAGTLFEGFDPELPIVVTAKDWVKLRRRSDLGSWKIWIARHEVRIEPADEFRQLLYAKLAKTP